MSEQRFFDAPQSKYQCEACKSQIASKDSVTFLLSDSDKPDGVLCFACWMRGCIWAAKQAVSHAGPNKEEDDA